MARFIIKMVLAS